MRIINKFAGGRCKEVKREPACGPLRTQRRAEATAMRVIHYIWGALRQPYPQGGSCSSARCWPLLRSRRWVAEAGAAAEPASVAVATADATASSSSSLARNGAALPCPICEQLGWLSSKLVYAAS